MTDLYPAALDAAVRAYDAARCIAHGGDAPMSERNRQTVRPMIAAAIRAYLEAAAPKAVERGLDLVRGLAETDFSALSEADLRHVLECWKACAIAALGDNDNPPRGVLTVGRIAAEAEKQKGVVREKSRWA